MVEVRSDQIKRAASKIRDDAKDLHISGQPGIGKTTFLDHLISELEPDFAIERTTVRPHHDQSAIKSTILHSLRRIAPEIDSKVNQLTSISTTVGPIGGGGTVDDRARDIDKIGDLTRDWSGNHLILCIDEIHKLSPDESEVRGVIGELSAALGDNVFLVTAGQVSASGMDEVEEIHLNLFTLDETREYLSAIFGNISEEDVRNIHSAAEGHPLFLEIVCESSDEESGFELPEEKFLNNIEQRYIESLPQEDEEFLRRVAILPELDERTVSGIFEQYSPTEVNRNLHRLNRRAILEEVNRTDAGDRLYKIHERFRNFLASKHPDPADVHKRAFEYHIRAIENALMTEGEDSWEETLPHVFYSRNHLGEYKGEDDPQNFLEAIEEINLDYPERGIIVVYAGVSAYPTEAITLFRAEHERFSEWARTLPIDEPFIELMIELVDWGISQFEAETKELSDIKVEGEIGDEPLETKPFEELDLSEEHTKRLEVAASKLIQSFFIEEPHRRAENQLQAKKHIEFYGITTEILLEVRNQIKAILLDSNIGEEIEAILEDYHDSLGDEFQGALNSSVDFYQIRDQSMKFGYQLFDSIHEDLLLDDGVIEEIALEGGEILENAENPAFALFWYALAISYFRDHPVSEGGEHQLHKRFDNSLTDRIQFEGGLEKPLIEASELEDEIRPELEDPAR